MRRMVLLALVLFAGSSVAWPAAHAPTSSISVRQAAAHPSSWTWSGDRIYTDRQLWQLDSANGVYTAVWQSDNNWVIYHKGRGAIWSTGTSSGVFFAELEFMPNGTIRIKNGLGWEYWSNYRASNAPYYRIVMQGDGNLVEYWANTGSVVWATGTNGR